MAPELRIRKHKVPAKSALATEKSGKKIKASQPPSKRKAADDASPVTKKKTKVAKKGKALPKPTEPEGAEIEVEESSPFDDDDEEELGAAASDAMMKLIDTDGEDEDDENSSPEEEKAISQVPKVPKHKKAANVSRQDGEGPGVIYVGRIPHGFYEHQMRAFFSQFGDINKLRLSRNKATGASKHYAFIEFAEESTAEIVARTMDNYQLYERILKVKTVPQDKMHPDVWKGCNRRYKIIPRKKLAANKLRQPKTEDQWTKAVSKEAKRRSRLAKKLEAMDYEFDMPALAAPPKPIAIITAGEKGDGEKGEVLAIEATPQANETEMQDKTPEGKEKVDGAIKKDVEAKPVASKKSKKSRQKK